MLQYRADHPCEIGEQDALAGLQSPQTLVLSFMIDGTGPYSRNYTRQHQASKIAIKLTAPGSSHCCDFVHCGFADAGRWWVCLRPHRRHPQIFSRTDVHLRDEERLDGVDECPPSRFSWHGNVIGRLKADPSCISNGGGHSAPLVERRDIVVTAVQH
jgi:hypothetical protein